jgi:hypothetical protein
MTSLGTIMNEVRIDRLTLQVPGLTPAQGRRLALQVAAGIATAGAAGGGRDIPALRLDLTAAPGAGADVLAEQIVAEVLRQVRRLP